MPKKRVFLCLMCAQRFGGLRAYRLHLLRYKGGHYCNWNHEGSRRLTLREGVWVPRGPKLEHPDSARSADEVENSLRSRP